MSSKAFSEQLDREMMQLAIAQAKQGFPAPNPHVGCIIVKDGEIVGKGHHNLAGEAHAEVNALREAGEKAKGATVYVTLEPCNHTGKTGPCSQALIGAGVKRVVIGTSDPNTVASGGFQILIEQGIEVEMGVEELGCIAANERWITAIKQSSPFVSVKMAVTLDGKVAWDHRKTTPITSENSRRAGHFLRSQHSAILSGRSSIELDNSQLNVRLLDSPRNPTRIILDPKGKLSPDFKVFDRSVSNSVRIVGESVDEIRDGDVRLPLSESGVFDPVKILSWLWDKGHTSVLIEGGPATARHFFEANRVDAIELFVAPKVFGQGINWLPEGIILEQTFYFKEMTRIDDDVHLSYRKRN